MKILLTKSYISSFQYFLYCLSFADLKNSVWHYLSILSGPLLACTCGSFMCLIPIHNTLEQPSYWYEDTISRILCGAFILTCQNLLRAEYWSQFSFANKGKTYIVLIGLMHGIQGCAAIVYYYIWTKYMGFYQPMALNHFLCGSVAVLTINFSLWHRYTINKLSP